MSSLTEHQWRELLRYAREVRNAVAGEHFVNTTANLDFGKIIRNPRDTICRLIELTIKQKYTEYEAAIEGDFSRDAAERHFGTSEQVAADERFTRLLERVREGGLDGTNQKKDLNRLMGYTTVMMKHHTQGFKKLAEEHGGERERY